jgi:TatD DNase family protein
MRLVDTHSHIHDRRYDSDREAVIARARDAGVECIVTLGTDRIESEAALALAEHHDIVVAAAGVHPHDAAEVTDADLDALETMAADPRVVLVGEIGLDFWRMLSPPDRQRSVLRRQLETAARVGKPVAIHTREALDAMLEELTAYSLRMDGRLPDGRPLGVMHYFSEDLQAARRFVALGFMISVHTSVTHPKAEQLARVAARLPVHVLVLETDSPYGAPQRVRGQQNEPAFVADAAIRVAELRGMTPEEVGAATTQNALRLLGMTPPGASSGATHQPKGAP